MQQAQAHGYKEDTHAYRRFEASVLKYRHELLRAALRMSKSHTEAEDLVQEAVLRAWTHWGQFERGTNARAWAHRVLTNAFINRYRRGRRERATLQNMKEEIAPIVHGQPERPSAPIGDEVQRALEALPEEFRSVVVAVDLEDQSYREVAEELGCPVGTVMSRLYRGRQALKRRLRNYAVAEGYVPAAAAA